MARKPNPEPVPHSDTMNTAALAEGSVALTEAHRRSAEISERFGDGSPYERSRVVNEARFYMGQSAEAMLELGKRLIQLKENEPHGEFVEILTERLGIQPRSAQLMMQASAKYLSPALESKAKSVSLLGRSKLFDLMAEADDDIEQLADGGTLAGHTLDEMASMTRRELQAALAEARKANAAKDKVIQSKSTKLDKLEEQLAGRQNATMDEAEGAQVEALRTATLDAEHALLMLLATVDETISAPATQAAETCARSSLDYLVQRMVDACLERAITVDLAERVSPMWAAPLEEAAARGGSTPRRARK